MAVGEDTVVANGTEERGRNEGSKPGDEGVAVEVDEGLARVKRRLEADAKRVWWARSRDARISE